MVDGSKTAVNFSNFCTDQTIPFVWSVFYNVVKVGLFDYATIPDGSSLRFNGKFTMHYLIIEDDKAIRDILAEVFDLLETEGVFTFLKDGNEAWAWLDTVEQGKVENLPDIAFVDIRMPGPQGHEIAERVRKMPKLSNIGIILMTAYELTEEEYKEVMERSQADRYISKPLPGVKGLNQMVKEIMTMRHSLID